MKGTLCCLNRSLLVGGLRASASKRFVFDDGDSLTFNISYLIGSWSIRTQTFVGSN